MAAEVISLAQARLERRCGSQRLPLVLNAHQGAVEVVLGTAADEEQIELWLSAEQALELAEDLRRAALAAQSGGGR